MKYTFDTEKSIKSHYFFFFLALGCVYPYLSVFLKEHGLFSDRQIGLFYMVRPFVALCAQPLWGYVADVSGRRPQVSGMLGMAAALSFPLILLADSFLSMFFLLALWNFFLSPLMSLGDSITFSHLGPRRRSSYTTLRKYGTIGFLVSATLLGGILDTGGMRWIFIVYTIAMVIGATFIFAVPKSDGLSSDERRGAFSSIFRNKNLIVFIGISFIIGVSSKMAFVFFSIYARSLGATHTQLGILWSIATAAELCIMLLMRRIIARIGVKRVLFFGFCAVSLRWLCAFISTQWWHLISSQLLHMLTFAFVYVGSVTFIDIEASPRVRSSAQAVFSIIVFNCSLIIGGILSGEISQRLGYRSMFAVCSLLAAGAALLLLIFVREPQAASTPQTAPAGT